MTFLLSKLLWFVVRPSTLLLLLACAGLALTWSRRTWTRRARLGRWMLLCGLAGLVAITMLPVGNWLLIPLEERFPRPERPPEKVDGIIVLSGAVEPSLTKEHGIPSLNAAAERMTALVALSRRYPQARLIFTGGSGSLVPGSLTEADVARALFEDLGVASERVSYESRSRNTYENAVASKALADPKPGETWLLITSASHMPRAVGIFRRVGWPVIPWPVGYKSGHSFRVWYQSGPGQRIESVDWAVHEWVGLVAYWLLGRTQTLLP
ncbi:MAG: YdcF family protein [Geminicoccaceae bacterium]